MLKKSLKNFIGTEIANCKNGQKAVLRKIEKKWFLKELLENIYSSKHF